MSDRFVPFAPRPLSLPEGQAEIEHPNMPGERGEVPVDLLDHYAERGWVLSAHPSNPTPVLPAEDPTPDSPAEDQPVPEGDTTPTDPQED